MALSPFKEGDAFLASVDQGILTVPMHRESAPISRYQWAGLLPGLISRWLRNRPILVRLNLARLASVSYDGNYRSRWFDLSDRDGYSLRLLYSAVDPLSEKEAAVLTALRDQVITSGLRVDLDTRRALGISDYQP